MQVNTLPILGCPENKFVQILNVIRRSGLNAGKVLAQTLEMKANVFSTKKELVLEVETEGIKVHYNSKGFPFLVDQTKGEWPDLIS